MTQRKRSSAALRWKHPQQRPRPSWMGRRASCFASEPLLLRERGIITRVGAESELSLNQHIEIQGKGPPRRFSSEPTRYLFSGRALCSPALSTVPRTGALFLKSEEKNTPKLSSVYRGCVCFCERVLCVAIVSCILSVSCVAYRVVVTVRYMPILCCCVCVCTLLCITNV